ncbi:BapA prefix-like domain-containing protein, partial [Acinetobacter sp. dk771]
MSNFVVIDKETQDKVSVDGQHIVLNDASIVKTGLHREDVSEFLQDGNNLILKLKNGDIIVIENFFVQYEDQLTSDLVFEDDECAFLWFDLTDGVVSFKELSGLELLLPVPPADLGVLPWIAGGLVGGGLALIDGGSSKDSPVAPKAPVITIDPVRPSENENTTLTGTVDNPNADVTVNVGGTEYPVTVNPEPNEDGTYDWTVDVPTADLPPAGEDIPVNGTVTDPNTGLTSPEVTEQAPVVPIVTIDRVAVDDVINKKELVDLTDSDGIITITGTVSNPSADLVISFNGQEYSGDQVTVTPEGKWSIKVPATSVKEHNDITAQASVETTSGKTIESMPVARPVEQKTSAPEVTVTIEDDGTVSFKFSEPVLGFDMDDIQVIGGQLVAGSLQQDPIDSTKWTAEITGTKPGYTLDIAVKEGSYTDSVGNAGTADADEVITIVIHTVTPLNNKNGEPIASQITGMTKPGNVVTIDVAGKEYKTVADQNGKWTIQTDKPLKETEINEITASTPNQDGNAVADTAPLPHISIDVIAGDDIINEGELAALTDENGLVTITGTVSNPSADLVINFNGQEYSGDEVTVTPEGQWSIKVPASSVQENNNVIAGGSLSVDGKFIDIIPVDRPVGTDTTAPTVTVTIEAGESNNVAETVNFSFSKPVQGFDESDLIVSGATLVPGSLVQNADGTWTAQLTGAKQGQAVEVQVKDKSYTDLAGNAGTAGDDEVVTIKINSVTPDSTSGGSKISGTTKPGNTVEINVPGHDAPYTVTADKNGNWTIITDEPLKDTDTITASTPDQDQAATTDTVPLPHISIDVIAGDDIINAGELAALTDENGLVTITGTVSNPSADLVINFNGQEYSGDQVTVTPDGQWSIKVPASSVQENNNVLAGGELVLEDGTTITIENATRPVGTDTTAPAVSVEVAPGYNNPVAETATFTFTKPVTGFDESDLIVSGASIVPGSLKQNADGTWTVQLTGAKQGQPVYVEVKDKSYTDLAGNPGQSDSDEVVTIKINTVTPQAATDSTPAGSKITGTTKPGNTVEIQVPGREEPYSTVADDNGNWTIITDEPLKDTDTITATTPDQDQAATTDTVPLPHISIDVIAGDDIINEGELAALTDENGLVTITGTVSNPSADLVINFNGQEYSGDEVTVTPEGQWSIKVPASSVQENNNVLAGGELVLEDGTTITIEDATRPVGKDTTPPSVIVKIDPQGNIFIKYEDDVDPSTINPEDILITDANGQPVHVTLEPSIDGLTYTAQLPDDINTEVTVIVPEGSYQDVNGNNGQKGQASTLVDTDAPSVIVTIDEDGTIIVKYEDDVDPKSINPEDIIVTDSEGNPVEVEFTPSEDGLTLVGKAPDGMDETITVVVPEGSYTDLTGNEGSKGTATDPIDTDAPSVTVTIDENGKITVQYEDDVDPKSIDPKDIVVTDKDGNPVEVEFTPSEDGLTLVGKAPEGMDETITVVVPEGSYTDLTGNEGSKGTATDPIDTDAPSVTVTIDENGKITVQYEDDVDPKSIDPKDIVVTDKDGNPVIVDFTPSEDGLTLIGQVPDGIDDKITVLVPEHSYQDIQGNLGEFDVATEQVDTDAPSVTVTIDENGKITVQYEDDVDPKSIDPKDIVVTDKDGNPVEVEFTPSEDGLTLVGQAPEGMDETITVVVPEGSYTDLTGNEGSEGTATDSIDTDAPSVTVTIDENGKITVQYEDDVDPESIDPKDIVVTDKDGNPVEVEFTPSEDGLTLIGQAPEGMDETITVVVPEGSYSDVTGNPGTEGTATDPIDTDAPSVTVTIDENGKITVQYADDVDPESIDPKDIVVTDKDGNPVEVEFTSSEDGLTLVGKAPDGMDENITVVVPDGSYTDLTGNKGSKGEDSQAVDTLAPTAEVTIAQPGEDRSKTTATIKFSEEIDPASFSTADLTVTGGQITGLKQIDASTWEVELKVEPGVTASVVVKDDSYTDLVGNEGSGDQDQLITIKITGVTPEKDAEGKISTNITGKTEPNADVLVTVPGQTDPVPAKADENGIWTLKVEGELVDGHEVTATTSYQDKAGNTVTPADEVELPYVYINPMGGDDVINEEELAEITVTVDGKDYVEVTGTISNPKADLTVNFNGQDYTGDQVTITDDGQWSILVPVEDVKSSNTITAQGKTETATSNEASRNPDLDNQAPTVTVTIDENGKITVQYEDDVDPSTVSPDDIIVTDSEGNTIEVEFTPSKDGLTLIGQAPEGMDEDITVLVPEGSYSDVTGNPGTEGTATDPIDTDAPTVTVTIDENGKITVQYEDDVDPSTVSPDDIIVTDSEGNTIEVEFTPSKDGLTLLGQAPDGMDETITVVVPEGSYTDLTGNEGSEGTATDPIDTDAPSVTVTIDKTGKITIQYEDDVNPASIDVSDYTVIDANGKPLLVEYSISEDGLTVTGQVTTPLEGKVTVLVPANSYEDVVGNKGGKGTASETVDTQAPTVTVSITPQGDIVVAYEDDVDPSTIDPKDIIITDSNGDIVNVTLTPSEDGLTFTGKVPSGIDEQITVVVPEGTYADHTGNIGTQGEATEDVDTDAPRVQISIDENGTITLTYPDDTNPDSIVTTGVVVKDPAGQPIENIIFEKQEDGTYTAKVPEEIDGKISVTVPKDSYEDLTGNPGKVGYNEGFIDTESPSVTVTIDEDGTITVKYEDDVDPSTIDPKDIIVTDSEGNPVEVDFTPSKDGLTLVGKAPEGMDEGITVVVPEGSYTDLTGNEGREGTATDPIDTDAPSVTVTIDEDGTITVQYEDDVDPSTIDPKDILVTDSEGNPVEVDFTPSEDGLTLIGKAPEGMDESITVVVPEGSYTDLTGNEGSEGTATDPIDTDAPSVTVTIDENGKITVQYEDDVDPKSINPEDIIVTDSEGNPVEVNFTPSEDGLTLIGKAPEGMDENITVVVPEGSYNDLTGNEGREGTATDPIDTDAPSVTVTIDENGTITVQYEDDVDPESIDPKDILVTDSEGNPVEVDFTPSEDGLTIVGKAPEGMDETITVVVPEGSYTDLTGNEGREGTATDSIDTDAPTVVVTIDEDGTITVKYEDDVDPESIDPKDILVTDSEGNPVEVDFTPSEDGLTLIGKAPEGMDESITVVVPEGSYTDLTGNEGSEGTATDPIDTDAPTVVVTIDENGTITVQYEDDVDPESIDPKDIIVTDSEGNPVEVKFTPSEDGLTLIGQVPDGIDDKITVLVPENSYQDMQGNPGEFDVATEQVDTDAPSVTVTIDENGKITVQYEDDVDPKSINPEDIKVTDSEGNTVIVDFTPSEDGLTLIGKAPEGMDESITVVVPEGSYTDLTGNEGSEGTATDSIDTDAPSVTVTIDENGTITVQYEDDVDPESIDPKDIVVTDKDGNPVEVEFTPSEDGLTLIGKAPEGMDESITVVVPEGSYADKTGNEGTEGQDSQAVDTLAPTAEVIIAQPGEDRTTTTATIKFSEEIDPASFSMADLTVTGGQITALKQIDETTWEVELKVEPGVTASVTVKDDSYTDVVGNLGSGDQDQLITIKITGVTPEKDAEGKISTNITGKTEPNADVLVTVPGQTDPVPAKADENGIWTVNVEGELVDGHEVTATTSYQDKAGNTVTPADEVELPYVYINPMGGDDVINEEELAEITVTVDGKDYVEVTGTISNPKADLTVNFNGQDYTGDQVTITEDGQWSILVPVEDVKSSNTITAQAETETATSNEAIRNPDLDNQAPTVVVTIDEDGTITVKYEDDVDPESIDPKDIVVTDKDGNPVEVEFTPSEDGLTFIGKAPEGMDETITVKVPEDSYADKAGNPGEEAVVSGTVDTEAPVVDVQIGEDGTITLTYPDDTVPESIDTSGIVITDPEGNVIPNVEFEKQPDGTYTAKVPEGIDGEITVKVPENSYQDDQGNAGE